MARCQLRTVSDNKKTGYIIRYYDIPMETVHRCHDIESYASLRCWRRCKSPPCVADNYVSFHFRTVTRAEEGL